MHRVRDTRQVSIHRIRRIGRTRVLGDKVDKIHGVDRIDEPGSMEKRRQDTQVRGAHARQDRGGR